MNEQASLERRPQMTRKRWTGLQSPSSQVRRIPPRNRSGAFFSTGRGAPAEIYPLPARAPHPQTIPSEAMAVLSHELRNSLCIIRMAAEILALELATSPAVSKARELIEHQAAHMSLLVGDLLSTARAGHGQLALNCQRVNLCATVVQATGSVELSMQRRGHVLAIALPAEPLWVYADPTRLEQVFLNLLLNAAKYTPPGGDIRLVLTREGGEAVVRINDNGIGIAPAVLPRVFDLFVQADPVSDGKDAGLGIGLALVRNLIDRQGGCVTAVSAGLGLGSEFTVRLPLAGHQPAMAANYV